MGTVAGAVVGAEARCAKAEAAVLPAAHALPLHRVALGGALAPWTWLQPLVIEESLRHLKEDRIEQFTQLNTLKKVMAR